MEEMESAQPWMKQDSDNIVKTMLAEAEKCKIISKNKAKYKAIADMMDGKSVDITKVPSLFVHLNRPRSIEDDERLTLEEYMKEFPEECELAMLVAKQRRDADSKDYNPNSFAKWRNPGIMPPSIHALFCERYPDTKERAKKFYRFFNMFPKFRISSKPI